MNLFQAIVLGIVQGITEFLPISSDGHLVLAESWLGLNTQQLKGFDVVLHAGTLLAMLIYFWKDILDLLNVHRNKIGYIVLASVPAVLAGLTLENQIDGFFREEQRVLWMLLVMAAVYGIAEYMGPKIKNAPLNLKNTFLIGVAQAFALLPGISRSGSTIAAGLIQGISRGDAARFSFLLGMPAIAGAVTLKSVHIYSGKTPLPETEMVIVGLITSAVVGYLSVAFLMKFLKKHSLNWFGLYLIFLVGARFLLTN